VSSLRFLFADLIGDEDDTPPFLPEGLPEAVTDVASDAIQLLIEYQSTSYAQLYADRLKRFVGQRGVDDAMLAEIARLMAIRMSYEDPIRIAQLKLAEFNAGAGGNYNPVVDIKKFRIDELVTALPAIIAEYLIDAIDWIGWSHWRVSIRFSAASRLVVRRLKEKNERQKCLAHPCPLD